VNSGPVTVTINGSGFALGDKLRVTCGFASDPTITSQSTATSLVVTIPNSDLQIEGTFGCQVQDVTSGNSTYPPVNFGVTTACPTQGNEAALANGSPEWMFLVKGENGGNAMAMAGILAPDGHSGITFGTEDINQIGSAPDVNEAMIQPSSYSEDSSGRGCLEFHIAKGLKIFHFWRTQMMEFDDTTGNGQRAVGQMYPTLPAGTQGSFSGGIFGLEGWDIAGGHAAVAGNFATQSAGGATLDGKITGGLCDTNDAGTVNSRVSISPGAYSIVSGVTGQPNGRGVFSLGAGAIPVTGVIHLGNVGNFIILSTTQTSASVPLVSGVGGGSNPNFLTNTSYYYLLTSSGKDGATVGLVNLASSGATAGAITGTPWQDFSGTIGNTALSGTYTITDPSWGRVTFSGSGLSNAPVAYVEGGSGYPSPVRGVTVGTDSDAESGTLFFQSVAAPNYTMANYAFHAGYSDVQHTSSGITTKIGVVTLDGNGGFTGTVDVSGPNGLSTNQSISGAYLVNPDGSGDVAPGPLVTSYFSSTVAPIYFIDESSGVVHPRVSKIAP